MLTVQPSLEGHCETGRDTSAVIAITAAHSTIIARPCAIGSCIDSDNATVESTRAVGPHTKCETVKPTPDYSSLVSQPPPHFQWKI